MLGQHLGNALRFAYAREPEAAHERIQRAERVYVALAVEKQGYRRQQAREPGGQHASGQFGLAPMVEGGEQDHRSAPRERRPDMYRRKRVADVDQPEGRGLEQGVADGQATGETRAHPDQRRAHGRPEQRIGHRENRHQHNDEGQVLYGDGQAEGGEEPGRGRHARPVWIERAKAGPGHEHEQRDLRPVMVDAARNELPKAHARADGQKDRDGSAEIPRDHPPAKPCGEQQRSLHEDGKYNPRQALGGLLIREVVEQANEGGDGDVHDPRPMHQHTCRRIEPPIVQIMPALPGHPVSHLDHAHGVIGVIVGSRQPGGLDRRQGNENAGDEANQEDQEKGGRGLVRAGGGQAPGFGHSHFKLLEIKKDKISQFPSLS